LARVTSQRLVPVRQAHHRRRCRAQDHEKKTGRLSAHRSSAVDVQLLDAESTDVAALWCSLWPSLSEQNIANRVGCVGAPMASLRKSRGSRRPVWQRAGNIRVTALSSRTAVRFANPHRPHARSTPDHADVLAIFVKSHWRSARARSLALVGHHRKAADRPSPVFAQGGFRWWRSVREDWLLRNSLESWLSNAIDAWVRTVGLSIFGGRFSAAEPGTVRRHLSDWTNLPAASLEGSRQALRPRWRARDIAGGLLVAGGGGGAAVCIPTPPGAGLRRFRHGRRIIVHRASTLSDRAAGNTLRPSVVSICRARFFTRLGVQQCLRIEVAVAITIRPSGSWIAPANATISSSR